MPSIQRMDAIAGGCVTLRRNGRRMSRHPAPDADGDPSVEGGSAHELDDVVVRRVHHRHSVDAEDLIAGAEAPVDIGGSARNDVADRDLGSFLRASDDAEPESRLVAQERHVHLHPLARVERQRVAGRSSGRPDVLADVLADGRRAGWVQGLVVVVFVCGVSGCWMHRALTGWLLLLLLLWLQVVAVVAVVSRHDGLRLRPVTGILPVELAQVLLLIVAWHHSARSARSAAAAAANATVHSGIAVPVRISPITIRASQSASSACAYP